jgi:hypothetical protein
VLMDRVAPSSLVSKGVASNKDQLNEIWLAFSLCTVLDCTALRDRQTNACSF